MSSIFDNHSLTLMCVYLEGWGSLPFIIREYMELLRAALFFNTADNVSLDHVISHFHLY